MQQVVADELYQGCYANPPLLLAATQTKSPFSMKRGTMTCASKKFLWKMFDLAIAKLLYLWVPEES